MAPKAKPKPIDRKNKKQHSIVSEDFAVVDPDPDTEYRLFLEKQNDLGNAIKSNVLSEEYGEVEEENEDRDVSEITRRVNFNKNVRTYSSNLKKHHHDPTLLDDRYTLKYRILKTFLLIFAFISFGFNFELIGPTLEDLRILLDFTYSDISLALVFRNIGYLILTILLGLFISKLANRQDLLMASASFITAFTNFVTTKSASYALVMFYFLIQGFAQSIYDVVGNTIILDLWEGISSSPIHAMHGGYAIGAIIAIQIAKPFIKFHSFKSLKVQVPLNSTLSNSLGSSSILKSSSNNGSTKILVESTIVELNKTSIPAKPKRNEIDLDVPYWIGALMAFIAFTLWIVAHFVDVRNRRSARKKQLVKLVAFTHRTNDDDIELKSMENEDIMLTSLNSVNRSKKGLCKQCLISLKKLIFGAKRINKKTCVYQLSQIGLFLILFLFVQGHITVITRFMQTYLADGPPKLNEEQFIMIEILFWSFFIFGRLFSVYVAFRVDSCVYYLIVLALNTVILGILSLPFVAYSSKLYIFILIPLLGLVSGPLIPGALMAAKNLLNFNTFVLSLFITSMAIGGIIFQEIIGQMLQHPFSSNSLYSNSTSPSAFINNPDNHLIYDEYKSAHKIPYISLIACSLAFAVFIPIKMIFNRYGKNLQSLSNY